ncbi:MAG: hypothetical protein CBC04_06555 [Verrucomicrobia bacterium TMED44]|nr:MAG: hypothetical protein CBC04_06555 [Verrucomicrobia bacterium TMED44]|tara:strand:- start:154 stop:588 length:435 start_codon:yes stop_codon:yes gene_type:complete
MPPSLQDFWLWTLEQAVTKPIWWYSWGVLLLLCLLLWVSKRIKKDLVPILSDEEGNVRITPHALQELVSKSCLTMPGIHSPSTSIKNNGGQIRLLVRIQVNTDCNVKDARKQLKDKLEHIMVENLCFSNFGGVDLIIKGFREAK